MRLSLTMSPAGTFKDADGREVTSELADFVPETVNGSVDIEFTFKNAPLAAKTIVAAETVTHEGVEVAVHKDLNDKDQTVYIPELGTTLTDNYGQKMFIGSKGAVLEDVVAYKNLPAGTYTMFGKLVSKADGSVIAESSQVFTVETDSETADGEVTVTFSVDTNKHKGEILVAFEYLFEGELKKVPESGEKAVHEDISDEGQTVYIPEIGTTAAATDGGKVLPMNAKTVIKDTVEYSGLIAGMEYQLKASVFDKTTGEILEGVTAEAKFKPDKSSGTVVIEIPVDTSEITGHNLVVFEELYVLETSERLIADHKDKSDKDQAVSVDKPHPHAPQTGDSSNIGTWVWVFGGAALALAVTLFIIIRTGKRKKNKENMAE